MFHLSDSRAFIIKVDEYFERVSVVCTGNLKDVFSSLTIYQASQRKLGMNDKFLLADLNTEHLALTDLDKEQVTVFAIKNSSCLLLIDLAKSLHKEDFNGVKQTVQSILSIQNT